jgi:hypothetical protein
VFQELAERPELAAVAEPLRRHPETAAEVAVAAEKNKNKFQFVCTRPSITIKTMTYFPHMCIC